MLRAMARSSSPPESRGGAPAESRTSILKRFRAQIARGEPIIGGGAGTGISAKSEEAGGIDLLIVYNSGRYRMAGRGSTAGLMPYGNANQIVKEMAFEILPVVKRTPVLAGVCGTDPFMIPRLFLRELVELGYAGIQNFPTVGLIEGELRATLEETGMGFGLEVDVTRMAHELDLLTTPYALTPASCVKLVQAIVDAAKRARKDVICLCHGGPIAMPEDAQYVIDRVEGLDGFYGASSTERLPTEVAIKAQIEAFKEIRLPRKKRAARR
jgi:predicted TIM-barrel enzyme